jgi:hypothetical protein
MLSQRAASSRSAGRSPSWAEVSGLAVQESADRHGGCHLIRRHAVVCSRFRIVRCGTAKRSSPSVPASGPRPRVGNTRKAESGSNDGVREPRRERAGGRPACESQRAFDSANRPPPQRSTPARGLERPPPAPRHARDARSLCDGRRRTPPPHRPPGQTGQEHRADSREDQTPAGCTGGEASQHPTPTPTACQIPAATCCLHCLVGEPGARAAPPPTHFAERHTVRKAGEK